jgi:F0F1-type ATP synthase assembly protein I
MPENEEENNNDAADAAKTYAKYTGIVFQMIAIIGLFAFIGYEVDKWLKHDTPWVTALCCVIGVCLSIFQVIRQLR